MKINFLSDIKVLVFPIIMLIILGLLYIGLIGFGFTKFFEQQQVVQNMQKEIIALQQKDVLLRDISTSISQDANLFAAILPRNDSTSLVISQIKNIALINGVFIDSLVATPDTLKDNMLSLSSMTLNLKGQTDALFSFFKDLAKIAPLISFKTITVNQGLLGQNKMEVVINTYWADFPKTLPASSESISSLTEDENKLITQLSTLTLPISLTLSPQSPSSSRISPF